MSTYGNQVARLLHVDASHFVAGAVWVRTDAGWVCTEHVAPILKWMRGKSAEEVGVYLKRKGWIYRWSKPFDLDPVPPPMPRR